MTSASCLMVTTIYPLSSLLFMFMMWQRGDLEDRGLGSNLTARFLIPHQHLDAFEKDPDRWALVCSKTHYSFSVIQHHRAL